MTRGRWLALALGGLLLVMADAYWVFHPRQPRVVPLGPQPAQHDPPPPGAQEPTVQQPEHSGDLRAYPALLVEAQRTVPVASDAFADVPLRLRNPARRPTAVRARLRSGEGPEPQLPPRFDPPRLVVPGRGQATASLTIYTYGPEWRVGSRHRVQVEWVTDRGEVIAATTLILWVTIRYADCHGHNSPAAGAVYPGACAQRAAEG